MTMCHMKWPDLIQYYQTDRQTDILLTEKKLSQTYCHTNERDIYVGAKCRNLACQRLSVHEIS